MANDEIKTGSCCSVPIPYEDIKLTQMTSAGG